MLGLKVWSILLEFTMLDCSLNSISIRCYVLLRFKNGAHNLLAVCINEQEELIANLQMS